MHKKRLSNLRAALTKRNIDSMLVTDMLNVFYLTGFTGSTASLVVAPEDAYLLVDSRYSIQARDEVRQITVRNFANKSALVAACELVNELKPTALAYESGNITVAAYKQLNKTVDKTIKRKPVEGIVEKLRAIKDAHEIEMIRKACQAADLAFEGILKEIKPGMTEKDVALELEFLLQKLSGGALAFTTIVATGPHSAWPHAQPGEAVIEKGHLLKMDFGAKYKKYCSDITRTVSIGKPNDKQKEIHQIVLDAQLKSIEAIAPGKSGKEIDAVGRGYITSMGYGDNFGHGLGHMLGIYVHDGLGFSTTSPTILEPGMVLTVEPGIYIEGWGGVRIEDDILVTDTGVEVITKAPRNLISL